jgi:hypothetical protein
MTSLPPGTLEILDVRIHPTERPSRDLWTFFVDKEVLSGLIYMFCVELQVRQQPAFSAIETA